MIGNVAGDLPTARVPLRAEMEGFDSLSPELREKLRYMSDKWSALGVQKLVDRGGTFFAGEVLNRVEGAVSDAYHRRLECVSL